MTKPGARAAKRETHSNPLILKGLQRRPAESAAWHVHCIYSWAEDGRAGSETGRDKTKEEVLKMRLVRWTPFRDLMTLHDETGKMLDQFFDRRGEAEDSDFIPALDVSENENEVMVKAEIPGMKKEDIKVSVKNDVLTISGEKKREEREEGENWQRVERSYGSFRRMLSVPQVDSTKVEASYKDGVLEIRLPKQESAKPKEIPIKVS
jgi:HSP20 family protein